MRTLWLALFLLVLPLLAAPNPFQQARTAADAHFHAAMASDRKAWGSTFAREHGDLAALWLQAQEAVRSGHKFTFGNSVSITDAKISLIYTKRSPKGKPVGGCPVTLIKEDGRWAVTEVSY